MDLHVGDRDIGHVQLERLPAGPVVERDEESELGPGIEQSLAVGILTHHPCRPVFRDTVGPVGQKRPALTVVIGPVEVGVVVTQEIPVDRVVCRSRTMG